MRKEPSDPASPQTSPISKGHKFDQPRPRRLGNPPPLIAPSSPRRGRLAGGGGGGREGDQGQQGLNSTKATVLSSLARKSNAMMAEKASRPTVGATHQPHEATLRVCSSGGGGVEEAVRHGTCVTGAILDDDDVNGGWE